MRGFEEDGDEMSPDEAAAGLVAAEAEEPAEAKPRRDLFPDIEEINSTLDSHDTGAAPAGAAPANRGGGFSRGFTLVVVLAAVALAVYLTAPAIAQKAPALGPILTAYVEAVNAGRAWLDAAMQDIIAKIEAKAQGGA